MLFSKYANPYFLLDRMISSGRFFEFVMEFIDLENERKEYEYWLHKVWDKSFEEFKRAIEPKEEINENDIETTITDAKTILSSFVPASGEGVNDGTI